MLKKSLNKSLYSSSTKSEDKIEVLIHEEPKQTPTTSTDSVVQNAKVGRFSDLISK